MTTLDKTYCASPECKNECGRKMTKEEIDYIKKFTFIPISFAYFCGEPFIYKSGNLSNKQESPV